MEKLFGKINNFLGGAAMLSLFVLSAAVCGTLILGRPLWLYLEGQKKEALSLFFYSLAWLFLFFVLALISSLIFNLVTTFL